MNRLNSIALLAGGALVVAAATGCASSAKPAASGAPAASTSGAQAAPSTVTVSAPNTASPGTSAQSGGTTAPAANQSSSAANGSAPSTAATGGNAPAPPASHPACANANLNATLAPTVSGQKATVAVIAVKNVGPTCQLEPIPYVWIVKSPTDPSNEARPLVPGGRPGTAKQQIILAGTTLYSAIDLNPDSDTNAAAGYDYLAVTANPTKNTSGQDVQDVQLPASMSVSNAMLSVYTTNPGSAINAIQYATTPEQ